MAWPKAKYYTRDDRCYHQEDCQPLPGDFSFRQEWPLDYCEEVECVEETNNETDFETDEYDECCGNENGQTDETGPLRRFDSAVRGLLQTDLWGQESPPRSHHRNLHPRILARSTQGLLDSSDAYTSGETGYWDFAKKLAQIEKHFMYEQALLAAEGAAEAAAPELAEEAALASARNYTISMDTEKKTISDGDCLVEVVSFLGITKPKPDKSYPC